MRRLLIVIGLIVAALLAVMMMRGSGGAPRTVDVIIPQGSSLTLASKVLEKAGAVRSSSAFLTNARLFGAKAAIKPGEYRIEKGMDAGAILALLQSGKTLQRLVTIPDGLPSVLVKEQLMAVPLLTGDIDVPAEGSVLPDSYAYQRGEARAAVLARMQAAMKKALAEAWTARKPGIAVNTPEQAVTLASIVEKETGLASERPMVAAVYSNRLKRGMLLQADPTSIYLTSHGRPIGRRILRSELDAVNDYNTYKRHGLPIGPITNPGRASIEAVLNPAASNAIFFVAKGDGSGASTFATTDAEHAANVAKYRADRSAREGQ